MTNEPLPGRVGRLPPSWSDLDTGGVADVVLAFLDGVAAVPAVAAAKRRSFALLAPAPGLRLLDAGCGTGADARALAELVMPGGEVVGVDRSGRAVAAARRSARGDPGTRFLQADAHALPFAGGLFDGSRADRVIQHVEAPERVVAELVRVTRPGGVVAVTELTFRSPQRVSHPQRRPRPPLLVFLPLLLRRAGLQRIVIEHSECSVLPGTLVAGGLGVPDGPLLLRVFHIAGVVGGSPDP